MSWKNSLLRVVGLPGIRRMMKADKALAGTEESAMATEDVNQYIDDIIGTIKGAAPSYEGNISSEMLAWGLSHIVTGFPKTEKPSRRENIQKSYVHSVVANLIKISTPFSSLLLKYGYPLRSDTQHTR